MKDWHLYSEKFISKGLSGEISYDLSEVKSTLLSNVLYCIQPLIFFFIAIPCYIPIVDQFCEFVATNWSRSVIGFVLRGVYWKTKVTEMGQDVFIDRWVSICPNPKNIFLGNKIHIDVGVTIQCSEGFLVLGDYSSIGAGTYINCRPYVIMGNYVNIANNCVIYGGSSALMDEEMRRRPGSSMSFKHLDLLRGVIMEEDSGLSVNVICSPDPWDGRGIDRKLIIGPMIIRRHTGIACNSYIDQSTGEVEMWAGNPAKKIMDWKPIVQTLKQQGIDLMELVEKGDEKYV